MHFRKKKTICFNEMIVAFLLREKVEKCFGTKSYWGWE